jgi:hypothetical protein
MNTPAQIFVPSGHILIRQARCDIKHDDSTFPMNVVSIAKATELLLSGRIPAVEPNLATVSGEVQRMHFHTNSC